MKLVDALVETLRNWGVRYVFGVSGANIEHLHDAIVRLGDGRLEAVLARSEVGAAFMADARARTHKTLGVCCATSGGGMMNLAVGIAESYAESVPVLAIVGQVASTLEGRGGFQDSSGRGRTVDAVGLFRAMAKDVVRVGDPGAFWEELHAAAKAALTGRPGPAVLLVPRDAYDVEVPPRPPWFPVSLTEIARPARPDRVSVARLFEALRVSRRPVLLLGTGAERCSDPGMVAAFARLARIPVATTMGSTGAFANDDRLYLGVVGAAGHPSAHAYLNEEADLVVAVGTGLNAMTRGPVGAGLSRARVAVVNVDPGEALRTITPHVVVEGDAGEVFAELAALHRERPFTHAPPSRYALTRYVPTLVEDARAPSSFEASNEAPLLQSEAITLLEPYLPEAGHVLFDAGNCAAAALHGLSIPRGTTSTIALGMGGMGYAIAGAIGAQLGEPRRARTVVLAGDGAFLMLGFEIHTAVELGLPILFVVFNNNKHGMCATRQQLFFQGRIACAEYSGLDVAAAARGLGREERLWVGGASTRAELVEMLARYDAVAHRLPGVLELRLLREEMPPFAPFLEADAPTYVVRETSARRVDGSARPAA